MGGRNKKNFGLSSETFFPLSSPFAGCNEKSYTVEWGGGEGGRREGDGGGVKYLGYGYGESTVRALLVYVTQPCDIGHTTI